MITHKIIVDKPHYKVPTVVEVEYPHARVHPLNDGIPGHFLGKQAYMMMLGRLSHKKGSYVVYRKNATFPYLQEHIFKIIDIVECYWLDPGNKIAIGRPTPFIIVNSKGEQHYAAEAELMKYMPKEHEVFDDNSSDNCC